MISAGQSNHDTADDNSTHIHTSQAQKDMDFEGNLCLSLILYIKLHPAEVCGNQSMSQESACADGTEVLNADVMLRMRFGRFLLCQDTFWCKGHLA